MIQLTAVMVRALAGNPLTVLVLLMVEKRPMIASEIGDWTNLSDKTLASAIRVLLRMGMITENGRFTYQIAAGVQQLPLGAVDALPEETSQASEPSNVIDVEEKQVGISDLALNESMNESLTELNDEDDSFIDDGAAPEIPDLEADRRGADLPPEPVTEKSLKGMGFYGKGLKEMLAIPGLTMREVRYQVEDAPNLGCALARIRKRQPVPENWERAGPETRSEYVSGKFADFIKH